MVQPPRDSSDTPDAVARTLAVVGDAWTLLILRDAFYGVRRFEDFRRNLGIARNILSHRLKRLVERGLFERRQYSERPRRHEYRLTARGRDLFGVLVALQAWGDQWAPDEPGRMTLTHLGCGRQAHAVPACSECGERLGPHNVRVDPVPVAPELRRRG
jgi:DNA-binding HxlR family transcriptional regulator